MTKFFLFAALYVICPGPQETRATQFLPLSIEQVAARADLVLRGVVQAKTCLRDPEGRIYTQVELAVSDVWKGPSLKRYTIALAGGTLGEQRTTVAGQPDYVIGEEIVAFLVRNGLGEGVTVGLAHGKFRVWQDEKTGEKLAASLFHGQRGESGPAKSAVSSQRKLTVAELKNRVVGH